MQVWNPTDAHRLQQLRLSQGLDTFAVAQRCAISERQLQELEGVGDGGFYSEAIKYQTGLKLLRALGDESLPGAQSAPGAAPPAARAEALTLPLHVAPPQENHKLLRGIGIALVLSGVLVSFVNVADGLGLRPGGLLLVLIGLGIIALVHRGMNLWAVSLLCWGLLLINFSSALVIRGLANVSWVAVPLAIMAAGWFMGRTMAWVFAGVSSLGTLAIYALHLKGFPFATDVPLETMLAGLLVSFAVAALIAGAVSQTYGRQFELIRESRAELHAVMDSTRAMIWSVSARDFSLRTFNRVCEKEVWSQWEVALRLGMRPEEVFGSTDRGQIWTSLFQRALDSQGLALEAEIFGDGRIFEVSFHPIRRDSQVIGLSVYAQDITERKQRQQPIPDTVS